MRPVWLVLRKDLLRRLRSPLASIVYLLFPFLFAGLIALAFGSGGSDQEIRFPLAVVDEDGGLVARLLTGAFYQEQVADIFDVVECPLVEALRLIAEDEIGGAIVIPAGFSRAVLAGDSTGLRVVKNPARSIAPLAVEEAAAMMAQLLDTAAGVLREPLQRIAEMEEAGRAAGDRGALLPAFPADERVAEIAREVNRALRGARRFALPPAIRLIEGDSLRAGVAVEDARETNRMRGIFALVLPGMATFALLLLALGFVADIPGERSLGTLQRQLAAPVSATAVLAGKVLSAVVMGLLVAFGMALVGGLVLGLRADPLVFLAVSVAFVGAATGLLAVIFGVARTERQGATLASILALIMSLLGGAWFPMDSLPGFVRALGPATLNYWGIQAFRGVLDGGATPAAVGPALAVLSATAVAGTLAGSFLLRRRLMRGL